MQSKGNSTPIEPVDSVTDILIDVSDSMDEPFKGRESKFDAAKHILRDVIVPGLDYNGKN